MRPLRVMSQFPGVRVMVSLLLDTLPAMQHITLLCSFLFFLFSIVGVQLWMGLLRYRCVLPAGYNVTGVPSIYVDPSSPDENFYCSVPGKSWGENSCPQTANVTTAAYPGGFLVEYPSCEPSGSNPGSGIINFDNTYFAWVTIFQVVTIEGWVEIMYTLMDAYSIHSWVYFVVLVFLGNFFAVNLFLIIINNQFSMTQSREHALLKA